MSDKPISTSAEFTHAAVDAAIKIVLIFIMVVWCFKIVQPFIMPILWGGIIAIALYPVVKLISRKLKLTVAKSSLLITLLCLASLIAPTVLFSGAIVSSTQDFVAEVHDGTLEIPAPKESVADLPLIGDKLYNFWSSANSDIEMLVKTYADEIKAFSTKAAGAFGSFGMTVLQFLISIIIAGVFMGKAEGSNQMFHKVSVRLAGKHGEEFSALAVATVRSVVQGVIGVAFIQSILAGVGLGLAGVPGTGIWMLMVLILAIIQLPPILILGPIIAYVFSVESSTTAILFMIWSILVSASDAFLKPMLMGRGVDIPMLVILLGAIGGMILSGIVGLFVGAVVLALSYKLFTAWLVVETAEVDTEALLPEIEKTEG
ncbi:AI-2E family transporter [Shewanella sp. 10N.7]|uniref:AI-2E family transporter n=1 Tax=Shewanella electrodiphila TaxID=934143 RepID=A0ABT0KR16_9GAMM|nr:MULTISPECIES: AI-2E family transporter [Shewanella]MCC4834854.1 AI-2E family transporter [Shewanella sp. 10N.7]MCL1046282.1 AI-2E family transporter [Shewanella electrodiphila]